MVKLFLSLFKTVYQDMRIQQIATFYSTKGLFELRSTRSGRTVVNTAIKVQAT
jgi:hypothetical protein